MQTTKKTTKKTKAMGEKAAAMAPAFEAVYHSIGDAGKKYSSKMYMVKNSPAFRFNEMRQFNPIIVKNKIQELRNKLLPHFRNAPIPRIDTSNLSFRNFTYTGRNFTYPAHEYILLYNTGNLKLTSETCDFIVMAEKKKIGILKNAIKGTDAAIPEISEALKYYVEKDGIDTQAMLPKTYAAYPAKVERELKRLNKLAKSMLKKCEKQLEKAQVMLAEVKAKDAAAKRQQKKKF